MNQETISNQKIREYWIPLQVLDDSQRYLRDFGGKRFEGYMCWSGTLLNESTASVRSCIYPKEYKSSNFRGVHAGLDLLVAFEMGNQAYAKKEFLLVQLHTHGFEAFHSPTDNTYPISHKVGFISIVIPFFARKKFYNSKTLVKCSVNEYLGSGNWRELSANQTRQRFKVVKES